MLLAVDAGNTRIKWALHDGSSWQNHDSVLRNASLAKLKVMATSATKCVICNVGGARQLTRIERALPKLRKTVVRSAANGPGITCNYQPPETLGADRWCALLALRANYGSGMAVLAGTAIIVDYLDPDGCYNGGLIVPGLHAMLAAIRASTGLTADPALLAAGISAKPNTTSAAIVAGAFHAVVGAIERQCREFDPKVVVVSGGDGKVLTNLLPQAQFAPNLILDGMLIAAQI